MRSVLVRLVVASAVALGLAALTPSATAGNIPTVAPDCMHGLNLYFEWTYRTDQDGSRYRCINGVWWYEGGGV